MRLVWPVSWGSHGDPSGARSRRVSLNGPKDVSGHSLATRTFSGSRCPLASGNGPASTPPVPTASSDSMPSTCSRYHLLWLRSICYLVTGFESLFARSTWLLFLIPGWSAEHPTTYSLNDPTRSPQPHSHIHGAMSNSGPCLVSTLNFLLQKRWIYVWSTKRSLFVKLFHGWV